MDSDGCSCLSRWRRTLALWSWSRSRARSGSNILNAETRRLIVGLLPARGSLVQNASRFLTKLTRRLPAKEAAPGSLAHIALRSLFAAHRSASTTTRGRLASSNQRRAVVREIRSRRAASVGPIWGRSLTILVSRLRAAECVVRGRLRGCMNGSLLGPSWARLLVTLVAVLVTG